MVPGHTGPTKPLLLSGIGGLLRKQKLSCQTWPLMIGNSLISAQRQHSASHESILPSPNSMVFNFRHTLKQLTSKTHIINMESD